MKRYLNFLLTISFTTLIALCPPIWAQNVIVDNRSPGVSTTGAWEAFEGYLSYDEDAMKPNGGLGNTATFTPELNTSGYYRVFAWWPVTDDGSDMVRFEVLHARGRSTVTKDQTGLGGQWNLIGDYYIRAGDNVTVRMSSLDDRKFLVDAMRFQFLGTTQPDFSIATTALPIATQRQPYQGELTTDGGEGPFDWRADRLPRGLALDPDTGVITGTPRVKGEFEIDISVTDLSDRTRFISLPLLILPARPEAAGASFELGSTSRVDASRIENNEVVDIASAATLATLGLDDLVSVLTIMPEGNWANVNLNLFSDVWSPAELRPLKGRSNPPPSKIVAAWSSFAWDSNRAELFIYGGGHANYPGNDVYRWRGATRQWERASLPSEVIQDDFGNFIAIDGVDNAPTSAHTYDNSVFLKNVDRYLTFGGAVHGRGGPYYKQIDSTTTRKTGPYLFDPSKADPNKVGGSTGSHVQRVAPRPDIIGGNMWENRDVYGNIAGSPSLPKSFIAGATGYYDDNGTDVVYVSARRGGTAQDLYRFSINDLNDPAQDTWERVGRYFNGFNGQGSGAYDPISNIFVRTAEGQLTYWDLATEGPANNNILFTPIDLTGGFDLTQHWGMDYDPVRHHFAMWDGSGDVWILSPPIIPSPNGWTVEKQPTPTSQIPNGTTGSGILGKWKYIPNLDAFLGLQDSVEGNIWLYKPVGWAPPATALDSDGDSLPDTYEVANGFDPFDPNDATQDADNDGATNLEEYLAGTDPLTPNAAQPIIDPMGGAFESPVDVSMTTITPNAQIYYTLDGSAPSPSSLQYSSPVTIAVSTTVKARAFLQNYTDSSTTTAMFEISSPVISLSIDSPDLGSYGNGFGTSAHEIRLIANYQASGDELFLQITGYDIDEPNEVSVFSNGDFIGNLRTGPNNGLNVGDIFAIPALPAGGTYQLEFRQNTAGWIWGVTEIALYSTDPSVGQEAPRIELVLDSVDSGKYGHGYGTDEHETSLFADFQGTETPLYFSLTGYDIDKDNEITVLLNGNPIGNLDRGPNNGLNAGNVFALPPLPLGSMNEIEIHQNRAGWIWGAEQLLVSTLHPTANSAISLSIGTADLGAYGNNFGTNENKVVVFAQFEDASGNNDVLLSVDGYDIDFDDEIDVLLNGSFIGNLSVGPNNGLNGGDTFVLPSGLLIVGSNILEFRETTTGWIWGVTNIGVFAN